MTDRIDQVEKWGSLVQVIFTGGEPFLLGEGLFKIIKHCSKKKLLTRIVSNAYWASSNHKAEKIISRLKTIGLTEINFSVDDFHQEFIPIQYIKNAVNACEENHLPVLLAHKKMNGSKITIGSLEEMLGRKLPVYDPGKEEKHNTMISTGWTVPLGKGSDAVSKDDWMPDDDGASWDRACSRVLEQLIFTPQKELSICCGVASPHIKEFRFKINGNDLLTTIEKANSDFITNWLSLEGPYGMMRFIKKHDPSIEFHKRYVQSCHLCNDIFTRDDTRLVLRKHMSKYHHVIQTKRIGLEYCREKIIDIKEEEIGVRP
jgi:hypothetical protein